MAEPLAPTALRRACDPATLPFDTTADPCDPVDLVGQQRAVEAVRFGTGIRSPGYNLFAIGPHGTGKQTLLRGFLAARAASEPPPADWVYVHDFRAPDRPRALKLPPGAARRLRDDLAQLVTELQIALPAAFESEEYRDRKQRVLQEFKARQETAFEAVQRRATTDDVAVMRSETGILLAPLRGGEVIDAQKFNELPEAEQKRFHDAMERTREALTEAWRTAHDLERQQRAALAALDRDVAASVAAQRVGEVRARWSELPDVLDQLGQVEHDVTENASTFLQGAEEGLEAALSRAIRRGQKGSAALQRYAVNVLVDTADGPGAPVVYEDNPTHANLLGRVEQVATFGALVTDFTLIKAGALHRANGGYLLLDALKLLQQPFAWDALKRALRAGEVRIESTAQLLGLNAASPLDPAPIPLACKVVLFGERSLYYLLASLDPDVPELFKVLVDFEDAMERTDGDQAVYARLVATLVRKEGLPPFDRGAVARVIEQSARLAEDAQKLTVQMRPIVDLVREAAFAAESAQRAVVGAADVDAAIGAQRRRGGRIADRLAEAIQRDLHLVRTDGAVVGQVNGLSVLRLGELDVGQPSRITARVRAGKGDIVDLEREVKLGGPTHSKGVLILTGYLAGRYARTAPLSLSASLVFEQSYGGVDGDSASLAELCALLSAIAEVPLRQDLAVTGSVSQHGEVQPVGGVNAKIEGFFDACAARGLTGRQGALLPRSNVQHLMLRPDVVAAAAAGRFAVYAVSDVDEALALLTGLPAEDVHRRVEARLAALAEASKGKD